MEPRGKKTSSKRRRIGGPNLEWWNGKLIKKKWGLNPFPKKANLSLKTFFKFKNLWDGSPWETQRRIFSIDEMIALFDPKDINRSASNYNLDKLLWLNSHYIKNSSDERLIKLLKDFGVDLESNPKSSMILNATKERGKTIKELAEQIKKIINPPEEYDKKALKEGHLKGRAKEIFGPTFKGSSLRRERRIGLKLGLQGGEFTQLKLNLKRKVLGKAFSKGRIWGFWGKNLGDQGPSFKGVWANLILGEGL